MLTILAFFVLESPSRKAVSEKLAAESKEKSNFFKDFGSIAKQPATWLVAIGIFAVYSFMSTLTYFTPYFTQVMGVTVTLTGWAAIARQYGMQPVGAPIGGIATDKVKSPAKVSILVYILLES